MTSNRYKKREIEKKLLFYILQHMGATFYLFSIEFIAIVAPKLCTLLVNELTVSA